MLANYGQKYAALFTLTPHDMAQGVVYVCPHVHTSVESEGAGVCLVSAATNWVLFLFGVLFYASTCATSSGLTTTLLM